LLAAVSGVLGDGPDTKYHEKAMGKNYENIQ